MAGVEGDELSSSSQEHSMIPWFLEQALSVGDPGLRSFADVGQILLWTPTERLWGGVPEPLFLLQELSVALYQHLLGLQDSNSSTELPAAGKELKLLCCDIDPELIQRAQQSSPFPASISFASLDIMDSRAREPFLSSYLQRFGRSSFDIGFCMSVTMWIHLNHGDRGLLEFLALLASLCTFLLVEPQPWKCYRAAARRLRRLGRRDFEHFRTLRIKGDMAESITRILTQQCAMELVCSFGSTSWDRSLLLFKSTSAQPEGSR